MKTIKPKNKIKNFVPKNKPIARRTSANLPIVQRPYVSAQMRVIDIPQDTLLGELAYNPTLFEENGKVYMVYRFHASKTEYLTDLAVVELDNSFIPRADTNKRLKLTRQSPNITTVDDPRAFVWNGRNVIVHAQGFLSHGPRNEWSWCSCQAVASITPKGESQEFWFPEYGNNANQSSNRGDLIACEKNWSPIPLGKDGMTFVYMINPLTVIEFDPKSKTVKEISKVEKIALPHWKWGNFIAGGTQLIRKGGEYVGIFHSFIDNMKNMPNRRTYFAGFYAISATAPHRITRMSKFPLLSATPNESMDIRINSQWKPNVIFPCGILERSGKVYISCGWQDCTCQIIETEWSELEKDVISV